LMNSNRIALTKLALWAVAAGSGASSALAHHSFAMFDNSKNQSISGTVRALEWSNPHIWLWVDVVGADGKVVSYGFEGAAPGEMGRQSGWSKRIVAKGDKVTVQYRPLKDGRPGGSLGKVTRADGTAVGRVSADRGGGPPGGGGPGAPGGPAGPGAPPSSDAGPGGPPPTK
jgi:hypothetical protein